MQVPVFCRDRRDYDADAKSQQRHLQYQQRQKQHMKVGGDHAAGPQQEIQQEGKKEQELDGKGDEAGEDSRNRHDHAGEVDPAKDIRVGDERAGRLQQAIGEVAPGDIAAHIEQERRHPIRGQFGDAAKDNRKHQGGQQRLDDGPGGAQDGLLVLRHKGTPDKERDQIEVAEQFPKPEIKPSLPGRDDRFDLRF